ncbi:MAG TPA: dihydropteroate synthase [Gammaproteobacteria bacterium]|nr:dihydropteroate synthase [Gammaproteobacteria bacterium]
MLIDCHGRSLDLATPVVMGILNVTPDSFSDGGRFIETEAAVQHALQMVAEGAGVIDIGGESSRPGAVPVSAETELGRILPVLERLAGELSVPISVDTSKPEVMERAIGAGAGLINDITALSSEGALEVVAASGAAVCLMHMQGEPRTMQQAPTYADVVNEIKSYLAGRIQACIAAGIPRERIIADPGFGFGKTSAHNWALLARLREFRTLGVPILAGLSRKSFIGALLDRPVGDRLYGSLVAAGIAVFNGADILRAHEVAPTMDAVRLGYAAAGAARVPEASL